jgi:ArsR family transcriptional regulator
LVEKFKPIVYDGNMTNSPQENALFERVRPLFNALGDDVRQHIVLLLTHQSRLSVGELTRQTALSRPAVSHHIKVLKEAGLVAESREGTRRYYTPTFSGYIRPMRQLIDCVEQWEQGKYITKREMPDGE